MCLVDYDGFAAARSVHPFLRLCVCVCVRRCTCAYISSTASVTYTPHAIIYLLVHIENEKNEKGAVEAIAVRHWKIHSAK